VAGSDLEGIGRTNDAILYGGQVTLFVTGDDESIAEIGPRIPASGSAAFGQPFLELFEAAGRDFYKLDPMLFSPAEVLIQNLETGRVHHFGGVRPDVLRKSFGM
jgi:methenyltetrahydromethanopterin cyclohydrolase